MGKEMTGKEVTTKHREQCPPPAQPRQLSWLIGHTAAPESS